MEILIGIGIILLIMFVMGKAFQVDLKEIEIKNPRYREYLRKKYKI